MSHPLFSRRGAKRFTDDDPKLVAKNLGEMKERAKTRSQAGYVVHVNKHDDGSLYLSDWYDGDNTVASYENGKGIGRTS